MIHFYTYLCKPIIGQDRINYDPEMSGETPARREGTATLIDLLSSFIQHSCTFISIGTRFTAHSAPVEGLHEWVMWAPEKMEHQRRLRILQITYCP